MATNGEHVEHALRGMGVLTIATVDHRDLWSHMARYEAGGTTLGMAHNEHVALQGLKYPQGIEQGFTLGGG